MISARTQWLLVSLTDATRSKDTAEERCEAFRDTVLKESPTGRECVELETLSWKAAGEDREALKFSALANEALDKFLGDHVLNIRPGDTDESFIARWQEWQTARHESWIERAKGSGDYNEAREKARRAETETISPWIQLPSDTRETWLARVNDLLDEHRRRLLARSEASVGEFQNEPYIASFGA